MRPIIGIVSNDDKDANILYDSDIKAIEKSGGEPIGLVTSLDDKIGKNILDMCDGFLFQGGRMMQSHQLDILEYAYQNNKPVLGICMGFELIVYKFFGSGSVVRIMDLDNREGTVDHYPYFEDEDYRKILVHTNIINKGSILYDIFGPKVRVNSRHIRTVRNIKSPFIISMKSEDGLIEGIEFINDKNFIIGVQFHPENLEKFKPLFDMFVKRCKKKSVS